MGYRPMTETEFDEMTEKEQMEELLRNGVVQVTFTKKDGSTRVLKGTKNMDLVPEDKHPKGDVKKSEAQDLITVYDIENDGWRSFHINLIQDVEAT